MSWRNQATHQQETKAVKEALKRSGIKAKVTHGTGTAWSWLEVEQDKQQANYQLKRNEIIAICQAVTGRHGDYDGRILVL